MARIIDVFVGGLIGFGASYFFRIYDRREKKNNFINGVQAELLEILPQFVGNVCLIKQAVGQFDHNILSWVDSVSSKLQIKISPQQDIWLKGLLKHAPNELSEASKVMATHKMGLALSLKPFSLKYLDHNIDTLPLIDDNYQKLLIEITTKIYLINQEIDRYNFYFEKTFDPVSCNVNRELLEDNIQKSYTMISDFLIKTTDNIVFLLLLIKNRKRSEPLCQLKNIIYAISNFFEHRRSRS